ncbi:MAG: flagellar filament capping protein FliD [Actinomycetota bacterium]|nr:flagellar filament capping protein FliD [Actinomycetota bacterium]
MSSVSPSSSLGSAYEPPLSFQGIESGLNTSAIISALMQSYSGPLDDLEVQQKTDQAQITAWQTLSSDLQSLQSAAGALSAPGALDGAVSASSSQPAVATATAGASASPGSVSFVVDQLAQAESLVSSGTVASTSDVVAGANLMLGVGGAALGIVSIGAGSGVAAGGHTISVTQASAGATVEGTSAPAASTTIGSGNDTLSVSLDGAAAVTYTLAAGTYSASELARAVSVASGGTLTASVGSSGQLAVATTEQGSAATLQVTGGSALGALGLSSSTTAATGTDAVVEVDGATNTVSDIAGSGTTTLSLTSGTGGTITVGVQGGLSAGSMRAALVSTLGGSLGGVVQAIDGSGLGVSASAVQLASGGYALEATSQATGTAGALTIDPQAFASSPLGTMETAGAAQDAIISVGGSGGPQVSSQTDTFSGLLPGVNVQVASVGSAPVTVTVSPDGSVVAPKVKALVDAANAVLSQISEDTAYDPTTKTAGPLNGQFGVSELANQVLAVVGQALGESSLGSGATAAGIGLGSNGTLSFDSSAFSAAYDANPSAVSAMLSQGGSWEPSSSAYAGQVSLVTATNGTAPGSYSVTISHAATQAVDTGTVGFVSGSSTVGSSGAYTVTDGSASATYDFSSGQTLSQVVSGLDAAFAHAGIDLSAELTTTGSGLTGIGIVSAAYGSAQSFTVSASGTDAFGLASSAAFTGTDVAGTIDGVAATGTGQILAVAPGTPQLGGLALQVTTPSVSSPTTIGSFDYTPGLAQGLASLAASSTAPGSGLVSTSIAGLQADSGTLSGQISLEQQVVDQERSMLVQEFNQLETSLAQIKGQGSMLGAALGGSSTSAASASTSSATTQGG